LAPSALALAIGRRNAAVALTLASNAFPFLLFDRQTIRIRGRGARATTAQEAPRPIRSPRQRLKATKRPRADVALDSRLRAKLKFGSRRLESAEVRRKLKFGQGRRLSEDN